MQTIARTLGLSRKATPKPGDMPSTILTSRSSTPRPYPLASTPRSAAENGVGSPRLPPLAAAGPAMHVDEIRRSDSGITAPPIAVETAAETTEPSAAVAVIPTPVAPTETKDTLAIQTTSATLGMVTLRHVGRMKEESIRRMEDAKAIPITTEQLRDIGIRHLNLGENDTERINFVSTTLEVYGGNLTDGVPHPTGMHQKHVYPAHIIDTAVLIAKNTPQTEKFITVGLNAFNEVRKEATTKYKYAADYVLKVAVKKHAERAYAGYIGILSVRNDVDKITRKRADAMTEWVHTLREDIKEAGVTAALIEEARTKQFLAELARKKYTKTQAANDDSTDNDEAI
jgi:hypothetical protein